MIVNVFWAILIASFALALLPPELQASQQPGKAAAAKIFATIDRVPDIDSLSSEGFVPQEPIRGDISFKDVSFNYPSRPNVAVLTGLTIHVQSGRNCCFGRNLGLGEVYCRQSPREILRPISRHRDARRTRYQGVEPQLVRIADWSRLPGTYTLSTTIKEKRSSRSHWEQLRKGVEEVKDVSLGRLASKPTRTISYPSYQMDIYSRWRTRVLTFRRSEA